MLFMFLIIEDNAIYKSNNNGKENKKIKPWKGSIVSLGLAFRLTNAVILRGGGEISNREMFYVL